MSRRIDELKSGISQGGPVEATIRALLYIRMPEGTVDARGFNVLQQMRDEVGKGLSLAEFKEALREQFLMLLLDERSAVAAIPEMLAKDRNSAQRMSGILGKLLDVVGIHSPLGEVRRGEIEALFEAAARDVGGRTAQ